MQIEGMAGLLRLYTYQLDKKEGQHSHFSFTALVADGTGSQYMQQVKKPIKVYLTDDTGKKTECVFCGLVDSVRLAADFAATKICVCASSYSLLLDQKAHYRIFQDEKKKMQDILSEKRLALAKDYGQVKLDVARPLLQRPCPQFVVQNGETNFAFLKRCSRALQIPFWVRDRQETLTLKLDTKTSNHTLNIPEEKVLSWRSYRDFSGESSEAELSRYVELGYVVTFPKVSSGNYLVTACRVTYEKGRDAYYVRLRKVTQEKLASGAPQFHDEHPLRLLAKVTNTEDPQHLGRLQVHFTGNEPEYEDLDEKKPAWLPYRSPYTGTKNGIVFLPDKGDSVEVTLLQGAGFAATAFRQQPLEAEAQKVADKYIGNNFQRRIFWKEKSLELWSGKNKVVLDDEKIDLQVGDTLLRLDKEGLHFTTQQGKNALTITDDAVLQSKGEFHVESKAAKIKSEGEIKLDSGKDMHLKGRKIKIE